MSTLNQRPEPSPSRATGRASMSSRASDQSVSRSEDEVQELSFAGRRRLNIARAVGPSAIRLKAFERRRLGQKWRHTLPGQLVRADVQFIIRVTLDPAPLDRVPLGSRSQGSPKVLVLDWLFCRRAPAVAFPAVDPACDSATQILGICVQDHLAGTAQGAQGFDRRGEFHTVVGGERLAALQLLFVAAVAQNSAPAARTGIARTGAVGPDRDLLAHRMRP